MISYIIIGFIIITLIEYFLGKTVFCFRTVYNENPCVPEVVRIPYINRGEFIVYIFLNIIPIIRECILFCIVIVILNHRNDFEIKKPLKSIIDGTVKFINSELW